LISVCLPITSRFPPISAFSILLTYSNLIPSSYISQLSFAPPQHLPNVNSSFAKPSFALQTPGRPAVVKLSQALPNQPSNCRHLAAQLSIMSIEALPTPPLYCGHLGAQLSSRLPPPFSLGAQASIYSWHPAGLTSWAFRLGVRRPHREPLSPFGFLTPWLAWLAGARSLASGSLVSRFPARSSLGPGKAQLS
jgi:hypothetical protein